MLLDNISFLGRHRVTTLDERLNECLLDLTNSPLNVIYRCRLLVKKASFFGVENDLQEQSAFLRPTISFSDHVELSITIGQPWDFATWTNITYFLSIIVLNAINSRIWPSSTVDVELHFGLDLGWNSISPTHQHESRNWRVVADLLSVGWAAVYVTLEGFPDDWIERFLHLQVKWGVSHSKNHCVQESVNLVHFCCTLQNVWSVTHAKNKLLEIAIWRKNVHWKTYVENRLAWNQILGHLG